MSDRDVIHLTLTTRQCLDIRRSLASHLKLDLADAYDRTPLRSKVGWKTVTTADKFWAQEVLAEVLDTVLTSFQPV